ncbi:class I SAM-dependent methyltransferase [Fodinicola acaciae]|uniref:class I SAM-dependent methyltransferase n=1 Tax=Fodinicola acaciae TaxID=2681555 RepID=UPI0013D19AFC|nr:class I SAM-dependent methyltransferase [Fodinicola acaciae]
MHVLARLVRPPRATADHAAWLDAFYDRQAADYDDFRRRLLPGREEMMRGLNVADGGRLLDMGGGTGASLTFIADRLPRLDSVTVVDLCEPLLRVARQRIDDNGWKTVRTERADLTTYLPPAGPPDAITFCYSLTMVPNWFQAIDHAWSLLPPGGLIGAVDFHVSRKRPEDGLRRHSRLQRFLWPFWFSWDNVFVSADHLPYLRHRFEQIRLVERVTRLPYLPGSAVPYYVFIGRKSS